MDTTTMHPTQEKLIARARDFFAEVRNLTPGKELEARLNKSWGPGTPIYDDLCAYIREGVEENQGWVATDQLDGARYRRSVICKPCPENLYFSITTVYMETDDKVYAGQYHQHPYGEINCVVQLDETAELKGMNGWQGAGWTSPGPGTHHYPEVRGGRLVALFFLPAGRISYDATPGMPQPISI